MDKEGLVPNQEEEMKRRDVIDQLKQVFVFRLLHAIYSFYLCMDTVVIFFLFSFFSLFFFFSLLKVAIRK